MRVGSRIFVVALFLWMTALHYAVRASTVDLERLKAWSQLKSMTLADYLPSPNIQVQPQFLKKQDFPEEARIDKDFKKVDGLFALAEKAEFDSAFVQADKLSRSVGQGTLREWIDVLKADFLYQAQKKLPEPKLTIALDEYSDLLRKFPLQTQIPRILYQIALINLELGFYKDADEMAERGLKQFGKSELAPKFMLVRGEQSFRAGNFIQSLTDLTNVIEQYPRSQASVDAAFRKAFIHFSRSDYGLALKTYENLEKYHSEEVEKLRMKSDANEQDRLIDRAFYAETLFLNALYADASKIFQDLSNLFPTYFAAPLLTLRFADTFYLRGRFSAAESLYKTVQDANTESPQIQALTRIRLADLWFLTKDLRAHRENEKYYEQAYFLALKAKNQELASFSLARLAGHHLYFRSYPKVQAVLRQYLAEFKTSRNQKWVEDNYIRTLELEVSDYYYREDYLAALATYMVADKEETKNFQDTKVLLRLADAAQKLALYEKTAQILNRVVYLEKSSEGRQEALLKLVEILILQGEYRKASERLRRFNFAYPKTSLKAFYERLWGDLYSGLKNPAKAIQHYEAVLEAARKSPNLVHEFRGIYPLLAEHFDSSALPLKAIEAFEKYLKIVKAVKENPLSTYQLSSRDEYKAKVARYRIADLHFGMKDYVRALESYRRVVAEIKEEPFVTHARYRMGECFLALDDRKSALEAFKNVKSEDPNNLWFRAAGDFIKTVEMEVKYGIKIFN